MTVVFVTGMSGTGKSTVLAELERRGHRVVDTDRGDWTEAVPDPDRGSDRVWREDRIDALLDGRSAGVLFLSGCVPNQGRFYPRFDAVVLLSAPVDVVLERVASRRTNDYGKTDVERARIVEDLRTVEPLLRAGATIEIDARRPVGEIADMLESVADAGRVTPVSAFGGTDQLEHIRIWGGVTVQAVEGDRTTLAVVDLEPDANVPEHRHDNEQLGVLVRGSMRFRIGDETRDLGPGETWRIPSDTPHAVTAGAEGALAVESFAPARADWGALERLAGRPAPRLA